MPPRQPSRTRSGLPAPRFCAVKFDTPLPRVTKLAVVKVLRRMAAVYPAMTLVPYGLTKLCTHISPTEIKACCNALGPAMLKIWRRMLAEKRGAGVSVFRAFSRTRSTSSERMQAVPCAINVAHATPATPHAKTATNSQSKKIFASEEPIKKNSGVLLSPRLLKMPVEIL